MPFSIVIVLPSVVNVKSLMQSRSIPAAGGHFLKISQTNWSRYLSLCKFSNEMLSPFSSEIQNLLINEKFDKYFHLSLQKFQLEVSPECQHSKPIHKQPLTAQLRLF